MSDLQSYLGDIKLDVDNLTKSNIKEGVTIFNITGGLVNDVDTSDADAIADDILKGKIGYSKEQRILGRIDNKGDLVLKLNKIPEDNHILVTITDNNPIAIKSYDIKCTNNAIKGYLQSQGITEDVLVPPYNYFGIQGKATMDADLNDNEFLPYSSGSLYRDLFYAKGNPIHTDINTDYDINENQFSIVSIKSEIGENENNIILDLDLNEDYGNANSYLTFKFIDSMTEHLPTLLEENILLNTTVLTVYGGNDFHDLEHLYTKEVLDDGRIKYNLTFYTYYDNVLVRIGRNQSYKNIFNFEVNDIYYIKNNEADTEGDLTVNLKWYKIFEDYDLPFNHFCFKLERGKSNNR